MRPFRLVILGAPVAHSLSPAMQGAALAAAGIPLRYEALHVEPADLAGTLASLVSEGAAGNVTIPHKEAVAALCDEATDVARRVGAVNTFWSADGRLLGDNTDVGGFDALARHNIGAVTSDLTVAVIGAGGAAAAVLVAVADWPGSSVRVHARGAERARELVRRLGTGTVATSLAEAVAGADVVVNATPLGLRDDDDFPVPLALLDSRSVLLDLVYRRGETAWVQSARADGHRAADGLGMLVEQGALAFVRWFGVEPDREAMWRALA
ncbi:MAG: shikimate dehydrogenase [Gemmatimonadaceae bacterium]